MAPGDRGTRLWRQRYNAFRRDGFDSREARWAANHKLGLAHPRVRLVRSARKRFIEDHMKYFGSTRKEAIFAARKILEGRNRKAGLINADVYNIFREISI